MSRAISSLSRPNRVETINAGEGRGLHGQRHAFCTMGLGTGMVGFYPTSARGSYECKNSINHSAGADPIHEMYCDGAR
eukprot:11733468-Alexandrium_andersonii.AAC.1